MRSRRRGRSDAFLVLLACSARPGAASGCSDVPMVSFANYCAKDVMVEGWNAVVPAGQVVDITEARPASNRIRWKYTDGSAEKWDFIELNTPWTGPGMCFQGHPSYSSYNGYNMASKYEALNPDTGMPACADMGAEVSYTLEECPTGPGNGYLCAGNPDCAGEYSVYIRSCSNAINDDGTRTPTSKDTTYGANYVNFWCSEAFGFHEIVATLMTCVERSVPFVLRITACSVGGAPSTTAPPPPTTGVSPSPPTAAPTTAGTSTSGGGSATTAATTTTSSSGPRPGGGGGFHPEVVGGVLAAAVLALAVLGGAAFGILRQRHLNAPDVDHGSGHVALARPTEAA